MPCRSAVGNSSYRLSMVTATVISALAAISGCASTSGKLESSADKLEHSAYVLGANARDDNFGADPGYSHDSVELTNEAHRLGELVSQQGAGAQAVKAAFERVSQSYHVLHDEVERSDSRRAHRDLRSLTKAFQDLQRQMGS